MKKKSLLISFFASLLVIIGMFAVSDVTAQAAKLSSDNPIQMNKKKKTITMLTTVNGTYFTQGTRHVIVNVDGTNGNKSLLKTDVQPKTVYNDLKKFGAKPGDNVTKESKPGTKVKGTKVQVYFVINGKKMRAEKAVQVNGKDVKDLGFKFGGNMAMNNKMKTGCVLCFDSCAVGTVSGSKYGSSYGEHFTGKSSVLPKDGKQVKVIMQVK
ncbi:YdjY domain-containing protein [Companilactobacillus keshanensis]|uniref:YdjY domain-containing protein n=1 Tax=Companilactobacillus keshanensis TaxID=2486003 RepID=A0ABW4BTI8_9LACO|nr:YdjY domain-containing protein [Companilactobacillus keshanensis]